MRYTSLDDANTWPRVGSIQVRPIFRSWAENLPRSPDNETPENMVAARPNADPDSQRQLLTQHQNTLLDPVFRDEPRAQNFVRGVDNSHRNRRNNLLAPIRGHPTDERLQSRRRRRVANENRSDQ